MGIADVSVRVGGASLSQPPHDSVDSIFER